MRKIFLRFEEYVNGNTIVMCTETTCSFSKNTFKGVVVALDTDVKSIHVNMLGNTSDKWSCDTFEPYKKSRGEIRHFNEESIKAYTESVKEAFKSDEGTVIMNFK